jgi:hypothetical protein
MLIDVERKPPIVVYVSEAAEPVGVAPIFNSSNEPF